jgi:hypothetical protein
VGRFNTVKYRPSTDSSPNTEAWIDGERLNPAATLVLYRPTKRSCPCGCGLEPDSKGRVFRMGHDARYRGKLIRAHLTGTPVAIVGFCDIGLESTTTVHDARKLAAHHEWEAYLDHAEQRENARQVARLERANEQVTATALGPQIGDRRLVKVGRWEYTGQVLAVYDNGDRFEVEYVTKKGGVVTTELAADKVGDLK